jgi:RNA polymerase subunit RPABC4/transcription elongation factor Spt4
MNQPDVKLCFKCGAQMNKPVEVCPECRERQPLHKFRMRWVALLIVAILAWLAFR